MVTLSIETTPDSHPLVPCELGVATYHRRRGATRFVVDESDDRRFCRKYPCIPFQRAIGICDCKGRTTLIKKPPRLHTPKG